ncbi:hypothetical protein [Streptomyces sp. KR80]|uniref:hypothetical protein n=1 Tax=Streptomyces sp. KR80 TaxID=3457426 RepID=UPI003FCF6753
MPDKERGHRPARGSLDFDGEVNAGYSRNAFGERPLDKRVDADFVTLRVKAEAANGDSVEQTTIRAYGVRR